ncbi:Intradiol ring-cleavage dioxygenase [Aspergillus bertholletiae]|uniref:Intradiol ring-cleavage dioxygenase n=1 Tax=Aspergillus bertholletiae TaxID=1226010 RepID=A0A5N7B7R4_9EURO|nr:Intradiol ring-cleavage dioxygenase [Aspergillus bertholletiae]
MLQSSLTLLFGVASIVHAHSSHDPQTKAFFRDAPLESRSLNHCKTPLRDSGLERRNIRRRGRAVQQLRHRRGLEDAFSLNARDLKTVLETSHHSSLDIDLSTAPEVLFSSQNTAILAPVGTEGPYYVSGEIIRSEVIEDQQGVPIYMDIQLIDTSTCAPVPDIYIDFWHSNALGDYSGVVPLGVPGPYDYNKMNDTFLRGVQKTNRHGIVQFHSIIPGHYNTRTNHVHILSHTANTSHPLANNTISGLYTTNASYVGQVFFDQDLLSAVRKTAAYAPNPWPVTLNADDESFQEEAAVVDPVVEYVYLGEKVEDGIFAWISVGIDPGHSGDVIIAAYHTEDGGVENMESGWFEYDFGF